MASWYHVLLSGVCKVGLLVRFRVSVIYLFDIHDSPEHYHLRPSPLYLSPPPRSPSYKSSRPSLLADATSTRSLKIMAILYRLRPYFTHTVLSAMLVNGLRYGSWLIHAVLPPSAYGHMPVWYSAQPYRRLAVASLVLLVKAHCHEWNIPLCDI
jgi:hypothetical protein